MNEPRATWFDRLPRWQRIALLLPIAIPCLAFSAWFLLGLVPGIVGLVGSLLLILPVFLLRERWQDAVLYRREQQATRLRILYYAALAAYVLLMLVLAKYGLVRLDSVGGPLNPDADM